MQVRHIHNAHMCLQIYFSNNHTQQTPLTLGARPSRSYAEPTYGLLQEAPRSTPPRLSSAAASEIGKVDCRPSWKRKRNGPSLTSTSTVIASCKPSWKGWSRIRLRTVIGSFPQQVSRPRPMWWTSAPSLRGRRIMRCAASSSRASCCAIREMSSSPTSTMEPRSLLQTSSRSNCFRARSTDQ